MKVSQIVEILNENGINVTIDKIIDQLDNIGALEEEDIENVTGEFDVEESIVKKFSKLYKIEIKPKKDKRPSESSKEINKREDNKNTAGAKFKAENEKKIEDILKQEIKKEEKEPVSSPKKEDKKKEAKNEAGKDSKNTAVNDAKNKQNVEVKNKENKNDQNNAKNKPNNQENKAKKQDIYSQEKEDLKNLEEKSFFEDHNNKYYRFFENDHSTKSEKA